MALNANRNMVDTPECCIYPMHCWFCGPDLYADEENPQKVASVRCTLGSVCLKTICVWLWDNSCICPMHCLFIVPAMINDSHKLTSVASVRCTLCSLCLDLSLLHHCLPRRCICPMHSLFIVPQYHFGTRSGLQPLHLCDALFVHCALVCLPLPICIPCCICSMHCLFIVPRRPRRDGCFLPCCICSMHCLFIVPGRVSGCGAGYGVASVRCTVCSLCQQPPRRSSTSLVLHLFDALFVHCAAEEAERNGELDWSCICSMHCWFSVRT